MNLKHVKQQSLSSAEGGERLKAVFFYGMLLAAMLFFVLLQPFGEPPDETGRYLIVQYICLNGKLPHGADPDILLYGYGGSYGFQPILTYIIQGYLLRFLFRFCKDGYLLLLAARLVNVVFGMIMAVYVRKTAKLLFTNTSWQWLFSVLVMFLPQSLFLHTYVNTDSMAMMSTAMMMYAWLTGYHTHWDRASCITLAAGISLCALSYYNAYGFILCSILFFVYTWFTKDPTTGKLRLNWKGMLQKGILISVIVLTCIGWWFIRNAILYDGDFLGLSARAKCTLETATEKYHPLTKETYYNTGFSLFYMIFQTDFLELLTNSTIATFGPMSIVTFQHIYTVIKWITLVSLLGAAVIPRRFLKPSCCTDDASVTSASLKDCIAVMPKHARAVPPALWRKPDRLALYGSMILCIIIPIVLCTGYSYMSDYQPQGRYILPMLVPFAYFMTLGVAKLTGLIASAASAHTVPEGADSVSFRARASRALPRILTVLITAFYVYAIWATLIRVVFPVYYPTSILNYIKNVL